MPEPNRVSEEPTDTSNRTAAEYLYEQFEFVFGTCLKCGKGIDNHTARIVTGQWVTVCKGS